MIVYLATKQAMYTISESLPLFPADLRGRIRVLSYGDFLRARELPVAAYVFSDIERLTPDALSMVARVRDALERGGQPVRLLNHPIRSMRRFELLRSLYGLGINAFNLHRWVDWPTCVRFPVFLRGEHDHLGPRTGLIADAAELERRAGRLRESGMPAEGILVVEFCQTRDARGIYRKYDAFVADGRIIPTDVYFSRRWALKWHTNRMFDGIPVRDEDLTAEEIGYFHGFAHHDRLREICALASIDYGRIDFAWQGDRIQIWEINTNPDLGLPKACSAESLATPYGRQVLPEILSALFGMFRSLDLDADPDVPIPIEPASATIMVDA